jgi:pimeloyl-ACP methyl ester carboxylesterase
MATMILHAIEQGQGLPVVLLHGLFGSARNLGTIARRLAADFRVIAVDLRDHGESPHAPIDSYGELADDVRETLAARGAVPAAVVGHSMGGKVAMRLALEDPNVVTRLVVADIAPVPYPSHFGAYAEAMAKLPITPALTRAGADAALTDTVPDRAVRLFLLQNLRVGPEGGWQIGLNCIRAALPHIEGWETPADRVYTGPTLFVAGARSEYIRPEHRGVIRTLFPAARFVTVKDAAHWLHVDKPDQFVAVIRAFLG